MRHFIVLALCVFISLTTAFAWANDGRKADHDALTELRVVVQKAFNTNNFDLMEPVLANDSFTVITIDGNKFESMAAFKTYWKDILEHNKTGLDRIEINPVADGPTEFLSENVGICHGTSNDQYFFTNGDVRTMPERWTAVVLKEGGDWKVSRIIFSANILDNPVLTGIQKAMQQFIILAGIAGLLVGSLGVWFFGRNQKKTT